MAEIILKPLPFDVRSAPLKPEEGFVLSRIDQPVYARDLAAMTGLPPDRIDRIVARLVEFGAVAIGVGDVPVRRSIANLRIPQGHSESPPVPESVATGRGRDSTAHLHPATAKPRAPSTARNSHQERAGSGIRARTSTPPPPTTAGLQLFEREFAKLSALERANRAQRADGDELVALCHDPHPQVIHALMANPRFSSRFARLVALYHRNPSGLELLARDRHLLADPMVQLCLLLNPHLTEPILERLTRRVTLGDLHRLGTDSRVPDDIRKAIVHKLRDRFNAADGEQRADLVYWSDGRALELLRGCTFDERTTSLLCRMTYTNPQLVRRLAAFQGTPSALLTALMNQAIVQECPELRSAIVAHPNAPRRILGSHA